MRQRLVIGVMLSLGLLLGACGFGGAGGAATNAPAGAEGAVEEGTSEGKRLPDAEFVTFAGERVRLNELAGQPLIVNFWATWCGPCRQEIPLLQEAYTTHRREGLQLIAVTDETKDVVETFMRDNGMSFPVMFDQGGRASDTYRIQGIPTTFFLDSNGIVVARHVGALEPTILRSYLEDLLAQPAGQPQPTGQPAQPAPTSAPAVPPASTPVPSVKEQVGMLVRVTSDQ